MFSSQYKQKAEEYEHQNWSISRLSWLSSHVVIVQFTVTMWAQVQWLEEKVLYIFAVYSLLLLRKTLHFRQLRKSGPLFIYLFIYMKKKIIQLKQACACAIKQLCYSIPLEWTTQWHAAMQLTGIKTIGKMTDYTGIEVHVCISAHMSLFLWHSLLAKLYVPKIFFFLFHPTHVNIKSK